MPDNLQSAFINSFNCRGLRDSKKRKLVFNWLKQKNKGITLLQETHTIKSDEKIWKREWGGDIFFSHGTSNSKGVAILIPSQVKHNFICHSIEDHDAGRILILNCTVECNNIIIVNLYAPTKDKSNAQNQFLEALKTKLECYSDKNIIIGGDFNVCWIQLKIKRVAKKRL